MFQATRKPNTQRTVVGMAELIYHTAVHNIRKSHRNALAGLAMNMVQTVVMIAAFYFMFTLLGVRRNAIRGEFLMFLMSGIFMFMAHTKAMAEVVRADGPTSNMMQHAPLNTIITIGAAALGSLYLQILSIAVILFLYHVLWHPVIIDNPAGAMGMLLLSWFTGIGVGIIFLSIKPWSPEAVVILSAIYSRVNMIASGKMFVANSLPSHLLPIFDWNPLFHTIDQARGDIFINYNPHFSSATYPLYVGVALVMIGLIAESYTRRHASVSWNAGR
jgi:ABC-type polysaccharide/polyol phosphate export permease